MRARVAVDIGGTFTDLVWFDPEAPQPIRQTKVLTTPKRLADGIRAALEAVGVPAGSLEGVLHASTVVINALIERRGAKTALLTTEGFRDVYEIGRINRPDSFNLRFRKHLPLVSREHVWEVPERILADGTVRHPLGEEAIEQAVDWLRGGGYDAVAVTFLHAYAYPEHEARLGEGIGRRLPELFVSLSHQVVREYREYERTSTTVANAFVGPLVASYLDDLSHWLEQEGFSGTLALMQSNGGLMDVALARSQPIQMVESGPAAGVAASAHFCRTLGLSRAIAFDMGGTTAKAAVVADYAVAMSRDYYVGGYRAGLPLRVPVLDLQEVGMGGGSIAWVEGGAFLKVGPASAGADPGPAAYGRGGELPTVTDADVVLGRLGGLRGQLESGIPLDRGRAQEAVARHIAAPLEWEIEAAAEGILAVAASQMAHGIRAVTVERGLDPSQFVLLAYGGGGPLHATRVARELGVREVVVPPYPGVFSALGLLLSDWRREVTATHWVVLDAQAGEALERWYQQLEAQALQEVRRAAGAEVAVRLVRSAEVRYVGQEHTVVVPMPPDFTAADAWVTAKANFDQLHGRRYHHSAPQEPAEVVNLRVAAIGAMAKPPWPELAPRRQGRPQPIGHQALWLGQAGWVQGVPVYERRELLADDWVEGPAIILEPTATTVLEAGDLGVVGRLGELNVQLKQEVREGHASQS